MIHAAKGMTRQEYEDVADFVRELNRAELLAGTGANPIVLPAFDELPRGGIVGMANIINSVPDHRDSGSRWHMPGCHGFVLSNARTLPFTPLKGALGFFQVPRHVVDALVPQVKDCQHGFGDICRAGQHDGIVCPHDSCDIDDGVRYV